MFEKFTDQARKVMALANQEAQRFNHEYVGTEHILLGLVKSGDGNVGGVLGDFDIDLRKVRLEVEKRIKFGPNMVTVGKLPQTPEAKSLVQKAIAVANVREENLVGTQHLLFAILSLPDTVAFQVLGSLCDPATILLALTRFTDASVRQTRAETGNPTVVPPPTPSVPTSREYLVFLGAAQVAARHPGPLTPEQIDQCLNDAIAILDRLIERRKSN